MRPLFVMRQGWGSRLRLAARFALGYATSNSRPLPNCLIIGAQKAGTSTLYEHLVTDPRVSGSFIKEVQFFDRRYHWGKKFYRAFFATGNASVVLEASPNYMFYLPAAERARTLLPEAKIVALLREPVARAVSSYHHSRRHGWEDREIQEAMEADIGCFHRFGAGCGPDEDPRNYHNHSYFRRGIYSEQLMRWQEQFGREQVIALKAEDLFSEPKKTVAQVQRFIGLSEIDLGIPKVANKNTYPNADESIIQLLRSEYEPEIERIEKAYGLSWNQLKTDS